MQAKLPSPYYKGWLAFAISTNPSNMNNGDTYFCQKTSDTADAFFTTNWISGFRYPGISDEIDQISDIAVDPNNSEGVLLDCSFTRPNAPVDGGFQYSTYDLSTGNFSIMVATGPIGSTGEPDYHDIGNSFTKYRSTAFNWLAIDAPDVPPADNSRQLLKAHATLLFVAWGMLIKISIFTAAFMKNNENFSKNGNWFKLHQVFNYSVAILTLVGILLAFAAKDWQWIGNISSKDIYSVNVRNHVIIGITTGSLCYVNVVAGILRPDKGAAKRSTWYFLHKFSGYSTLILADVTIFLGLFLWNQAKWSTADSVFAGLCGFNIVSSLAYAYFQKKKDHSVSTARWAVHVTILCGLGIAVIVLILAQK